jgi:hypothetical protein
VAPKGSCFPGQVSNMCSCIDMNHMTYSSEGQARANNKKFGQFNGRGSTVNIMLDGSTYSGSKLVPSSL